MTAVIASLAKAFGQLSDPAVLRVLAKSLAVTVAIFIALGAALWWALDAAIDAWIVTNLPEDYSGTVAGIVAVSIGLIAGWLLFRVVALAVLQFFADEIVLAVERRHYPDAAERARVLPFREDLANSMRGLRRAIGFNLLAMPVAAVLFFTAIGPAVVFLLVNAVLLGRELTDMAWLRHRPADELASPVGAVDRLILGGAIAGLMTIPFANFLAPVIGAAAGTHLTQRAVRERGNA